MTKSIIRPLTDEERKEVEKRLESFLSLHFDSKCSLMQTEKNNVYIVDIGLTEFDGLFFTVLSDKFAFHEVSVTEGEFHFTLWEMEVPIRTTHLTREIIEEVLSRDLHFKSFSSINGGKFLIKFEVFPMWYEEGPGETQIN